MFRNFAAKIPTINCFIFFSTHCTAFTILSFYNANYSLVNLIEKKFFISVGVFLLVFWRVKGKIVV